MLKVKNITVEYLFYQLAMHLPERRVTFYTEEMPPSCTWCQTLFFKFICEAFSIRDNLEY